MLFLRQSISICAMLFLVLHGASALASLSAEDNGRAYWVYDGETPVLAYNYKNTPLPEGVDRKYRRAGYIHPLCGLDGEILTEDFPSDHYHHRGVFWAWPETIALGKKLDTWGLGGANQKAVSWTHTGGAGEALVLKLEQYSYFTEDADAPILGESVIVTVHPADADMRAIDFELTFTNETSDDLVLKGQDDKNKGYGGFGIRPNATRKPFRFLGANGRIRADRLKEDSPWVDVSFSINPGKRTPKSGVALFQHADNPGYPHPGYLLRHFGFLGHSWPHREPYTLKPGDSITLRYRLLVHRNDGQVVGVPAAFDAYEASQR